jgi:hypothetical protein
MLQFRNETGLAGTIFASPDPDGIDSLYTVVKGTFVVGDRVLPAEQQVPVALAAEHHGDPAASSIRVPADTSLVKPATDVLLLGTAYAPGGRSALYTDVSLAVGPLHRIVRVFGDRRWRIDGVSHAISEPEPFQAMPLVWERAYGGMDVEAGQPTAEIRNPVGRGFRAEKGESPLDNLELPNLEDPYDPITSWKQRPVPVSFAPVCAHWEPRRSLAGTYDEQWQQGRAPYLPQDFDPRFFQLAPAGLIADGYLSGGEVVTVRGATPGGYLTFQLPKLQVLVAYVLNGSREQRPANLDTVIIEPDAMRVILVWRAVLACDKQLLRVSEVHADLASAA